MQFDIAECTWCHIGFFDPRNLKQHEPVCTKKPNPFVFSTGNGTSSTSIVGATWSRLVSIAIAWELTKPSQKPTDVRSAQAQAPSSDPSGKQYRIKCPLCRQGFATEEMTQHYVERHAEKGGSWEKSMKWYTTQGVWKPVTCDLCSMVFLTDQESKAHAELHKASMELATTRGWGRPMNIAMMQAPPLEAMEAASDARQGLLVGVDPENVVLWKMACPVCHETERVIDMQAHWDEHDNPEPWENYLHYARLTEGPPKHCFVCCFIFLQNEGYASHLQLPHHTPITRSTDQAPEHDSAATHLQLPTSKPSNSHGWFHGPAGWLYVDGFGGVFEENELSGTQPHIRAPNKSDIGWYMSSNSLWYYYEGTSTTSARQLPTPLTSLQQMPTSFSGWYVRDGQAPANAVRTLHWDGVQMHSIDQRGEAVPFVAQANLDDGWWQHSAQAFYVRCEGGMWMSLDVHGAANGVMLSPHS